MKHFALQNLRSLSNPTRDIFACIQNNSKEKHLCFSGEKKQQQEAYLNVWLALKSLSGLLKYAKM